MNRREIYASTVGHMMANYKKEAGELMPKSTGERIDSFISKMNERVSNRRNELESQEREV